MTARLCSEKLRETAVTLLEQHAAVRGDLCKYEKFDVEFPLKLVVFSLNCYLKRINRITIVVHNETLYLLLRCIQSPVGTHRPVVQLAPGVSCRLVLHFVSFRIH